MTETLSFPGLGLQFHLNRVAFQIGGFAIYWYGIIIAVAFLAGMLYAFKRVRIFGLDADRVVDVALGAIIGALVGARLYYVIFSWDEFSGNLLSIFNTRQGGIAIYGGVIGGFLAGWAMCKWRRVRFLPMADLAVGSIILGQAIGRWGNFVNVEAFGGNTSMPWGMTSPGITAYLRAQAGELADIGMKVDPALPVHPTFLYESVWCLIGFALIALYTKHRRFDGELVLFYAAWYGAGRFVIEGLRTDSLLIGTMRVSQLVALLCVIVSVTVWIVVRSRIHRSADPDYLRLYVETEEGQSVLAGTFYQKPEAGQEASGDSAEPSEPGVSEPEPVTEETSAEEAPDPGEAEEAQTPTDEVDESRRMEE